MEIVKHSRIQDNKNGVYKNGKIQQLRTSKKGIFT